MNNYKYTHEAKDMLTLAGPIIMAQFFQVLMGFIDTVMLGRYAPLDFAAGAMGASVIFFVILACIGIAMGISPIIARHVGANENEKVAFIFQQGVWLCFFLGFIAMVAAYYICNLLPLVGIEANLTAKVTSYVQILSLGMFFLCMYLPPRFLSEATEFSRPLMLIQAALVPVNIMGNYTLIFGNFGFKEMGVSGAAYATLIVDVLATLMIWATIYYHRHYKEFRLFDRFYGFNLKKVIEILRLSLPIAVSLLLEVSLFTVSAVLMGKIGVLALGAHNIAINYASMTFMVPLGIAMATTVKVGNALGRGDYHYAIYRAKLGVSLSTVFMVVSAIIIIIFNHWIVKVYTDNNEILLLAAHLLILAAIFQIPDGAQVSLAGALRGFKDTTTTMWVNLFSFWIVGFPFGYYLAFNKDMGAAGLWYGLIVGLSIAAVLLYWRMKIVFKQLEFNSTQSS